MVFIFFIPFPIRVPFYRQLRRGSTIPLGIWEEIGVSFIYVQNYTGCWLVFHFMACTLPGGLVV